MKERGRNRRRKRRRREESAKRAFAKTRLDRRVGGRDRRGRRWKWRKSRVCDRLVKTEERKIQVVSIHVVQFKKEELKCGSIERKKRKKRGKEQIEEKGRNIQRESGLRDKESGKK